MGFRLGNRGLWSAHEGNIAQNAQTMLDGGSWLIPAFFTGAPDYQKTPLYVWLVAGVAELTSDNVTAWTVRAPSMLAAIAGLFLVFHFARSMWSVETGVWAAIVLATTTRYAWLGRVGRVDMALAIVCLAAMLEFWRFAAARRDDASSRVSMTFYLLAGIAVMLKGPVALFLLGFPLAAFLLIEALAVAPFRPPAWRQFALDIQLVRGAAVVAAVAAPWFIYASWQSGGDFIQEFLLFHHVERALGTSPELKVSPPWFYIPRMLFDAFPWSLLYPAVALTFWRERKALANQDRASLSNRFLLAWLGGQFLFLTLVSFKRADYLLPLYPAAALLLSGWMWERRQRFERREANQVARNPLRRARWTRISAAVIAAAAAPFLAWAIVAFAKRGLVRSMQKRPWIGSHLNETDWFMLRHVEMLLRENWLLLVICLVVVVVSLWVFHTGWHERRHRRILSGLAVPWAVCFLFQIHVILPAIDPLREMSGFAEEIRTLATPDRPIYYYGKIDADLVFHAGKPALAIASREELVQLGQRDERCFVVVEAGFFASIKQDHELAVWTPIADNLYTPRGEHRDARILLTNRPSFFGAWSAAENNAAVR